MFVTEFGGPYQSSGLRPISIAMFDLIYAGKFERQYLENGKGYKSNGFKTVRQLYLAIESAKIIGLHCPHCRRWGAKHLTFNENVKIVANFLRPWPKTVKATIPWTFFSISLPSPSTMAETKRPWFPKFGREGVQNRPPPKFCPPFGETFWGGLPSVFFIR